ncbi:MAG: hypothetical protein NC924_05475 [Candidatus Omnitrophica bacterium]|nr:hypothetical protein [Candidatus Omnitrophota bacterium]
MRINPIPIFLCWFAPDKIFEETAAEQPLWPLVVASISISVAVYVPAIRWLAGHIAGGCAAPALDFTCGLFLATLAVCATAFFSLYWYAVLRQEKRQGYHLEPDFFRLLQCHLLLYPLLSMLLLLAALCRLPWMVWLSVAAILRFPALQARIFRLSCGITLFDAYIIFFFTLLKQAAIWAMIIGGGWFLWQRWAGIFVR